MGDKAKDLKPAISMPCPYCKASIVSVEDGGEVTCDYCKSHFGIRVTHEKVDKKSPA